MSTYLHSCSLLALLSACVAFVCVQTFASSVIQNTFVQVTRCPGQALVSGHRYQTLSVRSVLECIGHCRPDEGCVSVVFHRDRQCHLGNATAATDCHNMESASLDTKHFEAMNPCPGDRQVLSPDGVCVCEEGFRGTPCQPYIGDCTEGNFTNKGVYYIHPLNAPVPFQVYCRQVGDTIRTYVMDRTDSVLDFDRDFLDYQNGFGDLLGDHWIGLEKLHQLTSSKAYDLRFMMRIFNDSNFFKQYQNFVVSDAASGYNMQFDSTIDTITADELGDCLTPMLGAKFSTRDNDNDESSNVNCADKHAGGFWFRGDSCSTCNPTGPLVTPADGMRLGVDNESFWTIGLGNYAPFRVGIWLVPMDKVNLTAVSP